MGKSKEARLRARAREAANDRLSDPEAEDDVSGELGLDVDGAGDGAVVERRRSRKGKPYTIFTKAGREKALEEAVTGEGAGVLRPKPYGYRVPPLDAEERRSLRGTAALSEVADLSDRAQTRTEFDAIVRPLFLHWIATRFPDRLTGDPDLLAELGVPADEAGRRANRGPGLRRAELEKMRFDPATMSPAWKELLSPGGPDDPNQRSMEERLADLSPEDIDSALEKGRARLARNKPIHVRPPRGEKAEFHVPQTPRGFNVHHVKPIAGGGQNTLPLPPEMEGAAGGERFSNEQRTQARFRGLLFVLNDPYHAALHQVIDRNLLAAQEKHYGTTAEAARAAGDTELAETIRNHPRTGEVRQVQIPMNPGGSIFPCGRFEAARFLRDNAPEELTQDSDAMGKLLGLSREQLLRLGGTGRSAGR